MAGRLTDYLPSYSRSQTKVKPSLALPSAMMLWGLVSLLTAWVQNYAGLIAVRFMLGIVEGASMPRQAVSVELSLTFQSTFNGYSSLFPRRHLRPLVMVHPR